MDDDARIDADGLRCSVVTLAFSMPIDWDVGALIDTTDETPHSLLFVLIIDF